MKRSEAPRAKWARLIKAQAGSGMSAAEFCRRHRIWASSFFSWKRKLGKSDTPMPAPPGFVEAIVEGNDGGPRSGITIDLVGERRLTVGRGFDRQLLLDVIEALESCGGGS
jgi:hypothetical protein